MALKVPTTSSSSAGAVVPMSTLPVGVKIKSPEPSVAARNNADDKLVLMFQITFLYNE